MTDILQTQQLFSSLPYGVQRVFNILSNNNTKSVNLSSLTDYDTLFKNTGLTLEDMPFIQYLQENLSSIDTNSNGKISGEELTNMLSTMASQGYTYQQLASMASSNANMGMDQSLLQTVLANFNKVDVNHDGKVTQDEINNYQITKEIDDKKAEFDRFKPSDISLYYTDDSNNTNNTNNTDNNTQKNNNNYGSYAEI